MVASTIGAHRGKELIELDVVRKELRCGKVMGGLQHGGIAEQFIEVDMVGLPSCCSSIRVRAHACLLRDVPPVCH